MNLSRRPMLHKIALGLAILVGILILITLVKHFPALKANLASPFTQALMGPGLWSVVAETLFYISILLVLYGLVSLWLPDLRIILWVGVSLGVIAGLLYLVAGVLFYQSQGMGAPIQQGLFMFLISLASPFLIFKLLKRVNKRTWG